MKYLASDMNEESTVYLVDSKGDHVLIDENCQPILDEDGNYITYTPDKKVIH